MECGIDFDDFPYGAALLLNVLAFPLNFTIAIARDVLVAFRIDPDAIPCRYYYFLMSALIAWVICHELYTGSVRQATGGVAALQRDDDEEDDRGDVDVERGDAYDDAAARVYAGHSVQASVSLGKRQRKSAKDDIAETEVATTWRCKEALADARMAPLLGLLLGGADNDYGATGLTRRLARNALDGMGVSRKLIDTSQKVFANNDDYQVPKKDGGLEAEVRRLVDAVYISGDADFERFLPSEYRSAPVNGKASVFSRSLLHKLVQSGAIADDAWRAEREATITSTPVKKGRGAWAALKYAPATANDPLSVVVAREHSAPAASCIRDIPERAALISLIDFMEGPAQGMTYAQAKDAAKILLESANGGVIIADPDLVYPVRRLTSGRMWIPNRRALADRLVGACVEWATALNDSAEQLRNAIQARNLSNYWCTERLCRATQTYADTVNSEAFGVNPAPIVAVDPKSNSNSNGNGGVKSLRVRTVQNVIDGLIGSNRECGDSLDLLVSAHRNNSAQHMALYESRDKSEDKRLYRPARQTIAQAVARASAAAADGAPIDASSPQYSFISTNSEWPTSGHAAFARAIRARAAELGAADVVISVQPRAPFGADLPDMPAAMGELDPDDVARPNDLAYVLVCPENGEFEREPTLAVIAVYRKAPRSWRDAREKRALSELGPQCWLLTRYTSSKGKTPVMPAYAEVVRIYRTDHPDDVTAANTKTQTIAELFPVSTRSNKKNPKANPHPQYAADTTWKSCAALHAFWLVDCLLHGIREPRAFDELCERQMHYVHTTYMDKVLSPLLARLDAEQKQQ